MKQYKIVLLQKVKDHGYPKGHNSWFPKGTNHVIILLC